SLPDAVERVLAAKIEASAGNGGCGNEHLVRKRIGGEDFVFLAHFHHYHIVVFSSEVEPAVGAYRRRLEVVSLGQSLLEVIGLAGEGVQAAQHAAVGDKVELVLVEHGRGRIRIASVVGPGDGVRAGKVALAAESNGEQRRVWVPTNDINHAVGGNRCRNYIAAEAGGFPNELAGSGIIGAHSVRGADHHLPGSVVRNHQGRRPGADFVAGSAPDLLPRVLVERQHVRAFFLVELQKQGVTVYYCG